jgi:hypothetical protein
MSESSISSSVSVSSVSLFTPKSNQQILMSSPKSVKDMTKKVQRQQQHQQQQERTSPKSVFNN